MNRPTIDSRSALPSWRRAGSTLAAASTGAVLVAAAATPVVAGLQAGDRPASSPAPTAATATVTGRRAPASVRPRPRTDRTDRADRTRRATRATRATRARRGPAAGGALTATGPTYAGLASWYGPGFHGRLTANGERYDMYGLTAAHRTLPFGTKLRVCRAGRCTVVRINDRGPYAGGRILDLSRGAAAQIGLLDSGVARVTATVVSAGRR